MAFDTHEELSRLDGELARLASGYGRARLRVGREYERLARKSGHRELGFSSVAAYSYERCSQSGRWVADSRALARKLEALPVLRAALEAARISWSKAEILVQRATPENEAELLAQAQKTTVRGLRAAFATKDDVDEDEQRFVTLSLSLKKEDEILLEATRILLMEFEKGARGDQWVEALLAEGQTSLIDRVQRGTEVLPDDGGASSHGRFVDAMQEAELRRRDAEVRAENQIARELPHEERDSSDVEELSDDPYRLDKQLRSDAAELGARDQWMGLLGARFCAQGGWRALGYGSERQYCRERLGISKSSFRKKITLATGTARFPELERALLNGTIGVEAALLLARVMTADTEAAWVARAKERTFKHLREEIELVELAARINDDRSPSLPPDRDEIRAFEVMESSILSGRLMCRALGIPREDDVAGAASFEAPTEETVQMSGRSPELGSAESQAVIVQMSGGSESTASTAADSSAELMRGGPQHAVRLRVREEIGLWFRALEASFEQHVGSREEFVRFLCASVWRTWAASVGELGKWKHVHRRDRYRCASPVCFSHDCTLHHIVYRSDGGDDEESNTITACADCHIYGEHEGRLHVSGDAEAPTWVFGRRPILIVEDRVKRELR